jgi:hypothetical protein
MCNSQLKSNHDNKISNITKKYNKIDAIKLTAQTRGTNKNITFTQNSIVSSVNGTEIKSEITLNEWKNISDQANLIDLSKMSTYKSLTTERFSDRALASKIIITSQGKTYESSSFDEGIPPKELEGLYLLLKNKAGVPKRGEPKLR